MRKSDIARKGFVSPLVKGSVVQPVATVAAKSESTNDNRYFNVFWNKASTKKHKVTDDGYLIVDGSGPGRLLDSDRKEIAKARLERSLISSLSPGKCGSVGQYEFEVSSEVSQEAWNALAGASKSLQLGSPQPQTITPVAKQPALKMNVTSVTGAALTPVAPVSATDGARAYRVFWCKSSTKTHKTYDDGFLHIAADGTWTLSDSTGIFISKLRKPSGTSSELGEGSKHRLANYELEIQNGASLGEMPSSITSPASDNKKRKQEDTDENSAPTAKPKLSVCAPFKKVSTAATSKPTQKPAAATVTVHADALVLYRPLDSDESIVAVEPILSRHLRPHQREGIQFLYDCVMGIRSTDFTGCLLADEMGLGKTLQAIALLWTLLRQGPKGARVVRKCIVVCPAGLVFNWVKEVRRWLTDTRLKPLYVTAIANKKKKDIEKGTMQDILNTFSISPLFPLLIVSYEQVRSYHAQLSDMQCDLLICDEGHRIKNAASLVSAALHSLRATRRIILSGTPIQNDLEEFFCMMNFVCPGLLGEQGQFKRKFSTPIQAAREPTATPASKDLGQQLTDELTALTGQFIMRRTAAILQGYLPPKTEQVLVCRMTELQQQLYRGLLKSKVVQQLLVGAAGDSLFFINALRKICAHPQMVRELSHQGQLFEGSAELFCEEDTEIARHSGKVQVLEALLDTIRKATNDKVLLVSNYTQTLDMLEKMCHQHSYSFLRIDGATDARNRTAIVDRFNSSSVTDTFILLLSAKAGGIGFNVVGANRLIMFDPDWNPAVDRQVTGRVYRDGQKKPVFIYRLLTTGTIEEKIFQRQSHKQGLSSALVDDGSLDVGKAISLELLRDLFRFSPDTLSDTHDQLKCTCTQSDGEPPQEPPQEDASGSKASLGMHQLRSWDHLPRLDSAIDPMIGRLSEEHPAAAERISFVFSTSNGVRRTDEVEDSESADDDEEDGPELKRETPTPTAVAASSRSSVVHTTLLDDEELLELED